MVKLIAKNVLNSLSPKNATVGTVNQCSSLILCVGWFTSCGELVQWLAIDIL